MRVELQVPCAQYEMPDDWQTVKTGKMNDMQIMWCIDFV